jgi:hypothetical protein
MGVLAAGGLVLIFFATFALAVVILIFVSRSSAANSPVSRKIAQIARDFPDEVRAWGGKQAFRNPSTVRAIIEKLEGR